MITNSINIIPNKIIINNNHKLVLSGVTNVLIYKVQIHVVFLPENKHHISILHTFSVILLLQQNNAAVGRSGYRNQAYPMVQRNSGAPQ